MNLPSIVLLVIIGILFIAAIRYMVKRGGVCSCGTVGSRCSGQCKGCGCKTCAKSRK